MDLLDTILSSTGDGAATEIARRLGMGEGDTRNVLAAIVPALGRGLAGRNATPDKLTGLMDALRTGDHQRYLDDPAKAADSLGIEDGNRILGHILGTKDVSRQLAGRVAEQTGVGSDLIKQMLPMVATLAMGALSKQTSEQRDEGALQNTLSGWLDANNDGSPIDDLIGMAGKLFGR